MKNCAIVGWEEGLAGQISSWIKFNVVCYIHPKNAKPKIDEKLIKKNYSKNFDFPKNGKFNSKEFFCSKDWPKILKKKKINNVVVAISDNKNRYKQIKIAKKNKINILTVIHPTALILPKSKIEQGTIIEPFVYIGYKASIKEGSIIQARSNIDHNSTLGICCTVNPGSVITGNCKLGNFSTIHAGSVIKNKVSVGENSIVGAGSLVLKDVKKNKTVFGVPAK